MELAAALDSDDSDLVDRLRAGAPAWMGRVWWWPLRYSGICESEGSGEDILTRIMTETGA